MIRTQVYLDKTQVQKITFLAKQQTTKKAKIIRALIQKGLDAEKKQSAKNALLDLAALGKKLRLTGPTDVSTHHDTYLYSE